MEPPTETRLEAHPEQESPPEPHKTPALVINIYSSVTPLVGVLMLMIGLLAGYFGRPFLAQRLEAQKGSSATEAPVPKADAANRKEMMDYLISQVKHFKGDPNAPVTMIEFGDFQCPFCGKFATDAGPQIDEKYVESGKVRFGYWHMAFLGSESQYAAEASECAAEQGAFWEYHDYLFEHQAGENRGAFAKENLKQFAIELGLDGKAFSECVDAGKYTEQVRSMTQTAQSLGVNSTPAFVINGLAIYGAQPFNAFEQIIQQELGVANP